jgi:putative YhdH/YhfP family quinone oxidoreductase
MPTTAAGSGGDFAAAAAGPRCWLVVRRSDGGCTGGVAPLPGPGADADADAAAIRVEAAGFNYKDALACVGHPGVMRIAALVPGIDTAGTLLEAAAGLPAGAAVVATGNGLGETRHGGFAELVRAPRAAILPRPPGLSARDAMALGTAGLTALLACDRLAALVDSRHAKPDETWLVTGASGGVGMLAVACLAEAGRRVVACTRKAAAREPLLALGADTAVAPESVVDAAPKSLATGRFAGVVDTVGGPLLAGILKGVRTGGAVAAIGMAGGVELATTVHPFILRGVTLAGIDAATQATPDDRRALWPRLAAVWPRVRDHFPVTELGLGEVGDWAERMLRGDTVGRAVVVP